MSCRSVARFGWVLATMVLAVGPRWSPAGEACVVKLTAPAGATVAIDGREQGQQRTFTFENARGDGAEVAVVRIRFPGGGEAQRVAPLRPGGEIHVAALQPAQIVFAYAPHTDGPAAKGLYRINPDGSGLKQLTSGSNDRFPRISPDGGRIVFVRSVRESTSTRRKLRQELWVMDADGGGVNRLHAHGDAPAWSPDGTQIAFLDESSGPGKLSVLRADGGQPRLLSHNGRADESDIMSLDWSPDGTRIVYDEYLWDDSAEQTRIRAIGLDGRGARTLRAGSCPRCSPDGRRIGFNLTEDEQGRERMAVMGGDGSGARPLRFADDGRSDSVFYAWSPDGSQVVFDIRGQKSVPNADQHLYVLDLRDGMHRQLTRLPGKSFDADWR